MSENNRNPIEKCRKKLSQFTTMNVIDGQASLVIHASLIFYSLTIDNILNIIVAIVYLAVSIIFNAWAYSWLIWVAYAIYRFIVK